MTLTDAFHSPHTSCFDGRYLENRFPEENEAVKNRTAKKKHFAKRGRYFRDSVPCSLSNQQNANGTEVHERDVRNEHAGRPRGGGFPFR